MGVVYLGRDPVIGRLVALKTIRAISDDDLEQKEFGERFLREAQAAGILSHPNIVTVHDVGEDPETHVSYIAMEYVEGKNLKQVLQEKQPIGYERIAEIIGQVAEALDYAHRRGIVHRDVKPANIIITSEGAVKITDFGIAKTGNSNLTTTGQFLGTPNYMSPEQVTGEAVDGRSDLFSLGVVLYELLTRKKPFTGDNLTSISYKIVHEAFTPAETYDALVPPEFGVVLKKALAKDPAGRFQRGNDFALALYEFKAREEERAMLRDLSQMVAEAENLGGPVSEVKSPHPTFTSAAPASSPAMRAPSPLPFDMSPRLSRGGSGDYGRGLQTSSSAPPPPTAPPPAAPGGTEVGVPPVGAQTRPEPVFMVPDERTIQVDLSSQPLFPRADHGTVNAQSRIPTSKMDVEASLPGPELELEEPVGAVPYRPIVATPPTPPAPPNLPPARPQDGGTIQLTRDGKLAPELIAELVKAGPKPAPLAPPAPLPPPAPPVAARPRAPEPPPAPPQQPQRVAKPSAEDRPTERMTDAVRLALAGAQAAQSPQAAQGARPEPPSANATAGGSRPSPQPSQARSREGTQPGVSGGAIPHPTTTASMPAPKSGSATLKREVNFKLVVAIIGGLILVSILTIGYLAKKRANEALLKAAEAEAAQNEKEINERKQLLEEGNRLLAAGKAEEALVKLRELVRRAPDSAPAKEGIAKAEGLLSQRSKEDQRTKAIQDGMTAAREAAKQEDDARVLSLLEGVFALDPDNAEAGILRNEALARKGAKELEEAKKKDAEAAAAKKAKGKPTPVPKPPLGQAPVVPAPVEVPPTATPATARLRIQFQPAFPKGYLIVTVGSLYVREDFPTVSKVDTVREVPSGPAKIRVSVYTGSGTAKSGVFDTVIPGGDGRVLRIEADSFGQPSISLK